MFFFLIFASLAQAQTPAWIEASNQIAREYALADGQNFPERASATGYREFDGRAIHMAKDSNEREAAFLREWNARLTQELEKAKDENVRVDLKILRDHLNRRAEEIRLEEKHGVITFFAGTRFVLESLLALVNEQSNSERKAAAVDRFRIYVNGEGEHPPLLTSFRNRILADVLRFQKKKLPPLRAEVEQYLAESQSYLQGVKEALMSTGRSDWKEDFSLFEKQAAAFDEFLKADLMPIARKDFRLPKDIYAHILKMRGIEVGPEQLIKSARKEYKSLYKEFRALARQVAKAEGLKKNDPASVIRHLKKKQVVKAEEVKVLFENANRSLEEIIKQRRLVSLPKAPLRIRVAGEAESLANPIPHMQAPPLVNNKGERPEFVVPSFSSGQSVIDDFTYEAAAMILTAHEGRPGHDLQFSSMLDNGTSVIRARYAFNNSNVEGWGLYAEDMVFPYLNPASQLVALQMRLIRVARAFFDPEVQLGKIPPREVTRLLVDELGVSQRLATLELRRFQYDNPGQAPSYYYGLARMEGARRRVAAAQGPKFNELCFHDGVLSLGMLPLRMIGSELERNLKCGAGPARATAPSDSIKSN